MCIKITRKPITLSKPRIGYKVFRSHYDNTLKPLYSFRLKQNRFRLGQKYTAIPVWVPRDEKQYRSGFHLFTTIEEAQILMEVASKQSSVICTVEYWGLVNRGYYLYTCNSFRSATALSAQYMRILEIVHRGWR